MELFQKAMALIEKKAFKEALPLLKKINEENPNNPIFLYNLGMCYSEVGDYENAINFLEKCIQLKKDYSNAYVALGFAYTKLNDTTYAINCFIEALKIEPKNPFALRNIGAIYGNLGEIDKALYFLTKAYELDSNDPLIVYGLGNSYESMKCYKLAIKYFKEAINLNLNPQISELAKQKIKIIETKKHKEESFNMAAVFYCLHAMKVFEKKSEEEIKTITFEIGLKGQSGFDLDDTKPKYKLNCLDGDFSGLQLVCFMYVGFKRIDKKIDIEFDLSKEYKTALSLFKTDMMI